MELIRFVVIGAIAGWLAGQFLKGHGFGLTLWSASLARSSAGISSARSERISAAA
jgi:hypothetical protein